MSIAENRHRRDGAAGTLRARLRRSGPDYRGQCGSRGMMRSFMQDTGVELIDLASTGQEAIEHLKSRHYDIVLCDYNLGKGKDGQQVLEEARYSKFLGYGAVFIMVTAETTLEMVMGALEYQPDNYLSKPFTRNELQRRLERAVATKIEYKAIEQAFEAEDFEKTIALCQAKIAEQGSAYRAWRLMGESMLGLKRYDDAAKLYREVLEDRELAWAKIGSVERFTTSNPCMKRKTFSNSSSRNSPTSRKVMTG